MSVDKPPLRTAVIGYGLAGRVFHVPLIAANPAFALDLVVTSDRERAAQAAATSAGPRVVGSVEEVWSRAHDLDLVVVAAPTDVHVALARQAVEAGLAVVVDKPFAVTAQEGRDLVELARERDVPLTVFQNRRLDGDFLTVRRLVAEGALGEVYRFESRFERWSPAPRTGWRGATPGKDGGGITYDLGSHLVDQAIQLFGPVVDVYGEIDTHRPGSVNDDDAFIALRHRSGVRSHLWMSHWGSQPGPRFRVLGSAGSYVTWGLDGQEAALASGVLPTDDHYGITPPENHGTLGVDGSDLVRMPTERGAYPRFYDAVANWLRGRGAVPVDPADCNEVLRLIEQLRMSAA
ncbi:Gfo/Idh/MocA family protein [Pseudonocardia alaniniphila]|uniref:Gfo/Idh/MocA family oxidoreductase n=1 Tax=Pseudonocardia alaniniphila TaxID=75291 RepID=A0ABS9TU32_9PSEU|nr:Gfo/Idh/MocA family oxidoreductase [Pseudonocardia alaniniphila]MCH6172074.1 Gfo/Idh/MocA family oxidoreductase [Pseudonocardia alaniniphila]